MKRYIVAAAGALLALAPGRGLCAQVAPGDDVASLVLRLGAVSPSAEFTDGAKYKGGLAGGISFTYWAFRNVGVRLNYEMGKTEGQGPIAAPASAEAPTISFAGSELDFRFPVEAGAMYLTPYVGAGAGIKMYDWSVDSTGLDRDLGFAWNLTGGLDIRPASLPVGIVLEAQRFSSKYKWHGNFWEPPTVSDLLFTVGISLNR